MMYADDHQVYTAGRTVDVVQDVLAETLSRDGTSKAPLKCNQDKFQSIGFGRQKQRNVALIFNIMNNSVECMPNEAIAFWVSHLMII